MRYCNPSFINPTLLEDQSISLEKLLEDETAAMAFPLDAKCDRIWENPPYGIRARFAQCAFLVAQV